MQKSYIMIFIFVSLKRQQLIVLCSSDTDSLRTFLPSVNLLWKLEIIVWKQFWPRPSHRYLLSTPSLSPFSISFLSAPSSPPFNLTRGSFPSIPRFLTSYTLPLRLSNAQNEATWSLTMPISLVNNRPLKWKEHTMEQSFFSGQSWYFFSYLKSNAIKCSCIT